MQEQIEYFEAGKGTSRTWNAFDRFKLDHAVKVQQVYQRLRKKMQYLTSDRLAKRIFDKVAH